MGNVPDRVLDFIVAYNLRDQGHVDEPISKFREKLYKDASQLFRFVQPPNPKLLTTAPLKRLPLVPLTTEVIMDKSNAMPVAVWRLAIAIDLCQLYFMPKLHCKLLLLAPIAMGNMLDRVVDFSIAYNLRNEGLHDIKSITNFDKKLKRDADELLTYIPHQNPQILKKPPLKRLPLDEDTRDVVEQIYQDFHVDALNIALLGAEETGKISILSAMLNLPRGEGLSNYSGESKTAVQFVHPDLDYLRFWYLPDEFDDGEYSDGYVIERCLHAFDFLVIVETGKIRPVDIQLAKKVSNANYLGGLSIPVAFVRSNMDGVLISGVGRVANAEGWDNEKERITNGMRSQLRKQLDEAGLAKAPVYLVSHAGLLDALGQEASDDYRYMVDDFLFCSALAETISKQRYDSA